MITAMIKAQKAKLAGLSSEVEVPKATLTDLSPGMKAPKATPTDLPTPTDLSPEMKAQKATLTHLSLQVEAQIVTTLTDLTPEMEPPEAAATPLADLSPELFQMVVDRLDYVGLLKLGMTCRKFRSMVDARAIMKQRGESICEAMREVDRREEPADEFAVSLSVVFSSSHLRKVFPSHGKPSHLP